MLLVTCNMEQVSVGDDNVGDDDDDDDGVYKIESDEKEEECISLKLCV